MQARPRGRTIATVSGTFAICALALGASTASAQGVAPGQPAPAVQEIDLLFSQSARSGALKPRTRGRGQILVLHGVSETVWFENRPGRQSGDMPTSGFADAWSGFGFEADPPNAALSVLNGGEGRATSVVELYNPRFDTAADRLRFRAHPLGQGSRQRQRFPRHFEAASLFIDDATAPVVNSCVLQPWTDCGGADLSGANLVNATFQNADLTRANLSGANLYHANLDYAHLAEANLSGASASASFAYANLTAANLTNTDLTYANFEKTVFDLANLTGANLTGANVYNVEVLSWLDITLCNTTMPDATKNNRDC